MAFSEVAIEGETVYLDLIQGVYVDKKFEDLPDESVYKFENKNFKKYVDLIIDNDRKVIRFKPKRKGSATIRFVNKKDTNLILKQIKVSVQKSNLDKVATEIKSLLGEIEGIEIKIINNKVLVDGYILLAKDINRIAMVLDQYDENQVKSIVRLSPLTRRKIAERIEATIDNPNIYVNVVNDFFMLEGSESYSGEKSRAEEIAQAHVSDILTKFATKNDRGGSLLQTVRQDKIIINNITEVRPGTPPPLKMIQIIVHYVELTKSYTRGFNFSWAPLISDTAEVTLEGANLGSTNILSSITATISNLLPRLNWAREHGHARVLDTMNVTVQEKEQGVVKAEKNINRVVANSLGGVAPQNDRVQVSTTVTPELDSNRRDNVNMQIEVNIGEVTEVGSAGNQTVNNQVKTKITVRDKQSAAIGGLLRSTSSTGYNKDAADNSQTLFRLVASKSVARAQSQFVIFVTPIIRSSASQGMDKVKRKFRLDK